MPRLSRSPPAKITPPRQSGVVARERLFGTLDGFPEHAAVLLTAPPGAGKTTLLADYVARRGLRTVWYTCDAGDRDLAAFFADFGVALRRASPQRRSPLRAYAPEHALHPGLFARRYLRDAYAHLNTPCCLVLDDVQEAGTPAMMEVLRAVIEECPAGIRLFLLSREELPPGFTVLEAKRRLVRLDAAALRFVPEEAAAMLSGWAPEAVHAIQALTEGWAAGIVLAASRPHAPQGGEASPALPDATRERIFAYLTAEILHAMPPATQRIVLLTALLPEIHADQAVALTGDTSAPRVLRDLYRRQLFTVLRPSATYEYHGLFRAFLLATAEQALPPGQWHAARIRAARLLTEAGSVGDALALLTTAGEWDLARAALIEGAPRLLQEGRAHTLRHWYVALPEDARADPWLNYFMGLGIMRENEAAAGEWFERAYHGFAATGQCEGQLKCAAAAIRSLHGAWRSYVGLAEWNRRLTVALGASGPIADPALQLDVSSAIVSAPPFSSTAAPAEVAGHCERMLELIAAGRDALDANAVLTAARALVKHSEMQFDGALFERTCALVEPWLRKENVSPLVRGRWLVAIGRTHFLFRSTGGRSAKRDPAAAAWKEARQIAETEQLPHLLFDLIYAEVLPPMLRGEHERFIALVDALEQVVDFSGIIHAASYYYLRCRAQLLQDDVDGALRAGERMCATAEAGEMPASQQAWLSTYHAYALGAARREDEAVAMLHAVRARLPQPLERVGLVLESVACATLALKQKRLGEDHLPMLRECFGLAARAANWAGLYNAAPALAAMLFADALEAGIETALVRRCIAQQHVPPPPGAGVAWPWPIQVRLLGGFRLAIDGQPVEFGPKIPRKPLELLQLVLIHGDKGIDALQAIEALWPGADRAAGRASFNVAMHRLRKLLRHEDVLLVQDGRLRMDERRVWGDLQAFETLSAHLATTRLDALSTQVLESLAARLLDLYRGMLLAQHSPQPWFAIARTRLQTRFVQSISSLAAQFEGREQWQSALSLYERGIEQDPLAEALYRGQIRSYLGLREPAAALNAFRRCKELLSIVLGVQPTAETQALVRQAYS